MKLHLRGFAVSALFLILFAALPIAALAQQQAAGPITITKVTEDAVDPPSGQATKPPRNVPVKEKWIEVEATYDVDAAPKQFLDEVTFKVWIEMREKPDNGDEKSEGVPVMLTGEVTYVNVPTGRDNYVVFYVHPNAVSRYGTSRILRDTNVHVEAYVGGTLASFLDKNTREENKDYYKQYKNIGGLVFNKDQSPWVVTNVDRYPAIKPQK